MCPEVTDVMTDFTLQRPRLIYGVTKLFGELLGRYWNRRFGLDFRALRYPSIIGPGARIMGVAQCLPWALEYTLRREPYDLWLSEDTTVAIMYIKDAARAMVTLHDAPKENIKTMCYNIAGVMPAPTAGEWVKAIEKHIPEAKLSFSPRHEIVEAIKSGASMIDDSMAREEWAWEVQYPIDKLIPDFIREYEKAREVYEATPIPQPPW
jgi:threonine 3-dehydrogenase